MSSPSVESRHCLTPQRVLVAGATGYLGGVVVRELRSRDHFVRALARSVEKLGETLDAVEEVVVAEVTRAETLGTVCEEIDVVFSCVGVTRQKDGLSFRDLDYQGNANLLAAARRAGVKRFVYVSVFAGRSLRHLDIVAAHEGLFDELHSSGIESAVVRPTGYFSDISELFAMARSGRVWLIGPGTNRINPIHGADLAKACTDAVDGRQGPIDVGGPETLTWAEIARQAVAVLGAQPRITRVPTWLMWWAVRAARLCDRHRGELLAFFLTMSTMDVVAPASGKRTVREHLRRLGAGA